jgi:hypothetical protein
MVQFVEMYRVSTDSLNRQEPHTGLQVDQTSDASAREMFLYLVPKPDPFHHRREETNSGFWYEAPTYDSGSDETTFYAPPVAQFEDFHAGWLLIPNVNKPCHLRVKAVLASNLTDGYPYQSRLVVAGACRDLRG